VAGEQPEIRRTPVQDARDLTTKCARCLDQLP